MGSRVEHREVVVVGSGPAGSATALGLAAEAPARAGEVLVLEKGTHPRDKTCAGGLIPKTLRLLRALDLDVGGVPNVRVDRARVWTPLDAVAVPGEDLCRVVRRAEFDAMLAAAVRARGVELREGVHVRDLRRERDRIRIDTDAGPVTATVVVGADGSGSVVRRRLVPGGGPLARAVMRDVDAAGVPWDGHASARYEFDFRCLDRGIGGYGWAFPASIGGRPYVNVGAYALGAAPAAGLRAELDAQAARIGASGPAPWKAFPIRTYAPGVRVAAERVLLVGDAAGVEALLGEGISFSLEYGALAAEAIVRARQTRRWRFDDYQHAVASGPLGRKLGLLAAAAAHFYGPRRGWWFRAAHVSRRAQRLALAWYNGDPALDGLGRWRLAARMLHPPAALAATGVAVNS